MANTIPPLSLLLRQFAADGDSVPDCQRIAAAVECANDPASIPVPVRELAAHAARAAGSGHLRAVRLIFAGLTALAVGLAAATEPRAVSPEAKDREARKLAPAPPQPVVFARLGADRFRHPNSVFHAAFAPDGKKLATAALGSVSVFEAATGKLLRRVERAGVPFHRVAFTADGKTLYAVVGPTQEGCELLTLDPATGKERSRLVIRKRISRGAEFSPDATRLAVFPMWESAEAILFDPASGKELTRIPTQLRGNGFTPDGKGLILAGGNEVVRVIDAATGKETGKLEPKDRRPDRVRFTPGGAVLLAGDNWMERWDPKRNVSLWKADCPSSGLGLEVSPDGTRVAHVSSFRVTVLDVGTGKEVFRSEGDSYTAARFSPDGKSLALATASGVVALWDAAAGKLLPQSPDLAGVVSGLTFTHDGRQLIATAGHYLERWVSWDLAAARPNPRPVPLAEFAVLARSGRAAVRADTSTMADRPAEFVEPASGKRISRLNPPETEDTLVTSRLDDRGGLFSGDGRRFIGFRRSARDTGGQQTDLGLAVWEVATGKRIAEWPKGKALATAADVSPDGKAVAVLNHGAAKLAVWEPDTGRIRWPRDLSQRAMAFVRFARGGSWLAVQEIYLAQPPGTILPPPPPVPQPLLVLDAATGKEVTKALGPPIGMQPLVYADEMFYPGSNARAVSPDGRTAAFSGFDGTIYLWDLATDKERCKLAHPGPVHELAFSPDGQTLAAAGLAAPVVVYDLSGTRTAMKPASN